MNAVLTPAIITENALQAEEILSAPDIARPEQVLPDASDLNHISGAGLRSVLRLLKQYPRLSMINVSPEAYEIPNVLGSPHNIRREQKMARFGSVPGGPTAIRFSIVRI